MLPARSFGSTCAEPTHQRKQNRNWKGNGVKPKAPEKNLATPGAAHSQLSRHTGGQQTKCIKSTIDTSASTRFFGKRYTIFTFTRETSWWRVAFQRPTAATVVRVKSWAHTLTPTPQHDFALLFLVKFSSSLSLESCLNSSCAF